MNWGYVTPLAVGSGGAVVRGGMGSKAKEGAMEGA
jgi:hypothetical protein